MLERQVLRVYVLERDIYARQAIVSYLSWDRRTRVIGHARTYDEFIMDIAEGNDSAHLDVLLFDDLITAEGKNLLATISGIKQLLPSVRILCMTYEPHPDLAWNLKDSGASGYLVREDVNASIASAITYVMEHEFVVTNDVIDRLGAAEPALHPFFELPERRQYPHLTQRIEQALWLCVVEGLPAELAATEMGISTSTIRSYVKEGYRILEANDTTEYPLDLSPVELAFLRLTALNQPDDPLSPSPWRNAA